MKTLKFSEPLNRYIIEGRKNTTWRISDEKNIKAGEIIALVDKRTLKEFAKETTFENLNEIDRSGHEKFLSDEEMYETYSKYYKIKVTPKTKLKVIKFRILEKESTG